MFDKLLREMKKLERGVQVPIELPLDDSGYFDRVCPREDCLSIFKVLFEDWRDKVQDEEVFCPICREAAESTEWNTEEQQEHIRQAAIRHLSKTVNQALKADARRFNARQKPGFITMKLSIRPGSLPAVIPIEAASVMEQKFECEECQCRYASVGAAFFCPSCGHNSVIADFDNTLATVRKTVDALESIKASVSNTHDQDTAADTERMLLESCTEKLITALQRVTEALFEKLPNAASFAWDTNRFQRMDDASSLWNDATGTSYTDVLNSTEYDELSKHVQRRHKIGHRQAMVDQRYIDKSGDSEYEVGERLVTKPEHIYELARIVEKLVVGLQALVP